MKQTQLKTIFFVISHGWHSRLLLWTGVLKLMFQSGKYKIVIISQNADEKYLKEKLSSYLVLEKIQPRSGKAFALIHKIRRQLFTGGVIPNTIYIKNSVKADSIVSLIARHTALSLNYLFKFIPGLSNFLLFLDKIVFHDSNYEKLFNDYKPSLLVVCSVVHSECYLMLTAAQKKNVRTVFLVESWDNPTTKGNFHAPIDKYIVWNNFNKNELIKYHNVDSSDIWVTGSPYHNIYSENNYCDRKIFCSRYGLNHKSKIILISGTLLHLFADFRRFVVNLVEKIDNNYFGFHCQILIRPHPQVISGYSEGYGIGELEELQKLSKNIFFDIPNVVSKSLPVDIDEKDILNLAEIVFHADVVLSFLSTLTIDACAVDTPTILIGYDLNTPKGSIPSKLRLKYDHHKNVILSGGVKVALSENQLPSQIKQYLLNPSLDKLSRKDLVNTQCFALDGQSSVRIINNINHYLKSI